MFVDNVDKHSDVSIKTDNSTSQLEFEKKILNYKDGNKTFQLEVMIS